ncbi:biosynthetic-type acetolactate synthase large subunit [Candidatus Poribacteria bacterium]|nr:biosynthetic-type acetolactate synthase large subunit [Candidatus Poribacteria bacterium]
MILSGADILMECLQKEGVTIVFGFPGGQILPVYDALYKVQDKIKHYLTRHEQGAAHAADGYARATGKVGVCIATSGPGATNLVTGIATAYMDSIPMVAITGQVPTSMLGNDSFQEADIFGITRPITKYNYLVKKVEDLAETIKEAFYIARTGRHGPVLIDLPKDVQVAKTEFRYPEKVELCSPSYNLKYTDNTKNIEAAVHAINEAKQPVIYAGGGIIASGASKELLELAEKTSAPVTTTLMAMGAFPGEHPLSMGMLGMHGTYYANHAVTNCDLLIALGARFDDRVTGDLKKFAPYAKVIHIDIDPAEIGKRVSVLIPIIGDVKSILKIILSEISSHKKNEWIETIDKWRTEHPLRYHQTEKGPIKPQFILEKLYEITKGEAIITTEVGQNQMWAAQFFKYKYPRSFISSGGLGTMGYGFPAAIGAQAGCPDKLVIDIAGDGSIQMNIQELATAVQYNLPVKIIILNNSYLGMVRQWQQLFYEKRYSETNLSPGNPDFVAIAKGYGAEGIKITKHEEVEQALNEAINNGKTTILDFHVAREENVSPMVPAGAPLNEMIELA